MCRRKEIASTKVRTLWYSRGVVTVETARPHMYRGRARGRGNYTGSGVDGRSLSLTPRGREDGPEEVDHTVTEGEEASSFIS
jgi:hypothetical protein